MFRIEPTPTQRPLGQGNLWIIDHDREVTLERVGATGPDPEMQDLMKLVWQGRVVAFYMATAGAVDAVTGEKFLLRIIKGFGAEIRNEYYGVYTNFHKFVSDEEKRAAYLLAVEAVIMYGRFYNGDKQPDGYIRVAFEGRQYRRSDFEVRPEGSASP